ncbi:S8 family peptidase [Marinigracilibium pacificum]|uniref:S8/S53 family peptidase n=1 Tax=Marinigracilibium pacificum TaxID=2729599 RepID=A0A848IZJ0_9BACT|nr:S8/S53 family peptidase [Marinigracilibium pacificum]NMM48705.1 S8/S53 family peptidase [Marinigracilibium pacificum]
MRNSTRLILVMIFMVSMSSCEWEDNPVHRNNFVQISKSEINSLIDKSLQQNDQFTWSTLSDNELYSAIIAYDSVAVIGYQPLEISEINWNSIDVSSGEWSNSVKHIIDKVEDAHSRDGIKIPDEGLLSNAHDQLPFLKIKISSPAAVAALRKMGEVRFVEPYTYYYSEEEEDANSRIMSKLGCGNSPDSYLEPEDFVSASPSVKIPWNYYKSNIPQAWAKTTGKGVTIGMIDTGISPDQALLNSQFNSGNSSGRYIQKYGTYVSSWWWWANPDGPNDKCGHGTQMSGTIAGPRGTSGASVGVAYNANFVGVRGTGDVVIEGGNEKDGVTDALVLLGNRTDVRIISMSIGSPLSSGQVADGIRYAYARGKLIFCAAGTSTSLTTWYGVIFPANMNETVAVTGITDAGYKRCSNCHSGSKVDFTIVMQRDSDSDRTSLTLAQSGSAPSRVGGSSVATATTAGIAGLIWSTDLSQSRAEVLDKLKRSAELYPNRNGSFGWGTIDANKAITLQ